MNILGMGPIEIFIILLVAFIFLGPERMVDAGRMLGKAVKEIRRLSASIPDLVVDEDTVKLTEKPARSRRGDLRSTVFADSKEDHGSSNVKSPSGDDGPVAFKEPGGAPDSDGAGPSPEGKA